MKTPLMTGRLLASTLGLGLLAAASADEPLADVVLGDFETDTYQGWTASGDAFGTGPAQGTLPGQMVVEGYAGHGLASSFHGGDGTRGTLTSEPFRITHPYLSFLIGGGGFKDKTCLNLVVEGKVVRTATGPNVNPGGSERLSREGWDVRDWLGKTARLVIVDDATGSWGHISVDDIRLTATKPPLWLSNVRHEIVAEKRWLHLPIKNGAPKRAVTLAWAGEPPSPPLDIELADSDPDWWAPIDLQGRAGQKLTLTVNRLPEDSKAFELLSQEDVLKGEAPLYHEALRPQFHFSARRGWLNDPNGLVYHNGVWHLFFQHNPYGWSWGNMHWGHATSPDLFHWTEHGDALAPDALGPMFSGSAVVDWKNTSGLGKDGKPPIVLFYTAAGSPTVQCLAYLPERGSRPVKYSRNPILKELTPGNRDPKVIWHEPTSQWVMVLYVERDKKHYIDFFTSSNLKQWTRTSGLESFYECPDFFELPVTATNGEPTGERYWVLTGASSEYMLGSFDGKAFTPATGKLPGHRGKGFYAAQTYSDAPDGRRVQIGWLQAPAPGMPFNQCMSLPLELGLRQTEEGPRLTRQPVKELDALLTSRRHVLATVPAAIEAEAEPLTSAAPLPETLKLEGEIAPGTAKQIHLRVRGAELDYSPETQELTLNGHRVPLPLEDGKFNFTLYLDRTTLELFANKGLTYIPMPFIAKVEDFSLSLSASGGTAEVRSLTVETVSSIWPAR